ncbi:hypothetical protein PVOR_25233 [Paenibacillus vortex V453]|uniref:TOTE conflict system primase domain-containing protein n=1 Tax=Paenibacillus vortex V453 TaxID=715225 RepID=A0A2R9SPP2_9BACL|nr:hypothetical protein [Paenibacillus vortex]EFU39324.1 hypothetical protein PVOR_25233 [Paenibacillus vortex V453]
MEFSEEYLKKIIDKMFDLYLIQHKRYLMQFKGGEYKQNRPENPLKRYHLHKHLKGERTIGTFARTYVTKFLCFDVDFSDLEVAKWVTYKIGNSLDQLGLHHYYVSFSGKKGYHVELFLDKFIPTERAHQFYLFILRAAGIPSHFSGKVEYRPFATQGVKLPLGTHQGTGNFCGFCSLSNGLRVMDRNESFSYFLEIEKIDTERILSIVVDEDSSELRDMENAISSHNSLINYEQSGNYSVEGALELYHNGLSQSSQRHASFMLLARLMNHNQVCKEKAIEVIMEWLDKQDQRFYRSKRDVCLKDAENVVDFVYSNNLTLAVAERDLTVSFREINAIMRHCLGEKSEKANVCVIDSF